MKEIKIERIEKNECISFIQKHHYSKIIPRITKEYIAAYENNRVVACMTLGYGTQPLGTIKKIFPKENLKTKDYLEIGKMAFENSLNNGNYGSRFMSAVVKWIKRNLPEVMFLYTMADGIMGKCGYVYQASSFYYIGSFKTSVYMDKLTGEKIHPRSAKVLCNENAVFENKSKIFWLTHKFCEYKGIDKINGLMFRYIIPLNSKGKKIMKKNIHLIKRNPKEKDLFFSKRVENGKFVEIDRPVFNMHVHRYNHQKPKKYEQTNLFEQPEMKN